MVRAETLYRHSVGSTLKEAHLPRKLRCFSCPINITVITIGTNPQACRLLSKEIPVRVSSVPVGQTALVFSYFSSHQYVGRLFALRWNIFYARFTWKRVTVYRDASTLRFRIMLQRPLNCQTVTGSLETFLESKNFFNRTERQFLFFFIVVARSSLLDVI